MAAINETSVGRFNIKLTSSEFPNLSVEGKQGQRVNLRKQLNAKMKEARRKSGGPTGKSPSEKVEKKPDVEDIPTTKIGAQGAEPTAHKIYKPPVKKEKKELTAAQRAKRGLGPVKKRKGPAKMEGYGKDTSKDEGMLDWIKKGYQEWKRDGQPDDAATTGVDEKKNIPERYPTEAEALAPDPEAEKIAEEYEQQFLSDEALREQFDPAKAKRPEAIQDIIDDPKKLIGGQYPAWWSDEWKKKADDKGGVRPEPGESLLEFNKRLEGMDLTEEDLKGEISNEDFADQLILDEQRKIHLEDPKAKDLDIGPESGLDQERVPEIKKIFESKDPEAELIASEYEAEAAIRDAQERRANRPERKPPEVVKPKVESKPAHVPHGRPESYDYDKEDYEGKQKYEKKVEEIKKISERTSDYESRHREIQKVVKPLNKEDTAAAKEEAGNWYVDPWTGFAIDLNKLQRKQDRKESMEMAALLPADKRAVYLYQQDLIEKEDLDKLIEPSEKEKLARKLTEMQLSVASSNLLLNNKKLKNYQSPQQKEWNTSYRNAVTNDDYEGIYTFGRKLGLNERELTRIVDGHRKANLAKASKKDTDIFKKRFNIPYTKVWDARQKVMMESAKVFEEGEMGGMLNFGGQKYAGRKGLLEDNGLFELEDLKTQGNDKINQFFVGLKDKSMFNAKRWQKADGSHDYQKILSNPTAYNRLLQKNLIWNHMDTLGSGQYDQMEKYRLELQHRDESINQQLVQHGTSQGER